MKGGLFIALLVSASFAVKNLKTPHLGQPSDFTVTSVPGFEGTIPFQNYAGYLPANDGEKQLFFWFVESQNNPATDPVVLWLNGGPGCSSFDGFVYEHGPFFFNPGGIGPQQNLTLNPYSWNKVANMIYIDSPAGVGLSYSNNPNDYVTNDKITAQDTHNVLLNFFNVFSQFKSNPFYISGESYAGVYVPTLAQQVVLGNANPNTFINIKGILVGNGVTDQVFDGNAFPPFVYGHALIPNDLWTNIIDSCPNGDYWNASGNCNDYINDAANLVAGLNIYDIYDLCYDQTVDEPSRLMDPFYRIQQRRRDAKAEKVGDNPPCVDSSVASAWINQDSLRTAVHALPVSQLEWVICSDVLDYTTLYSTVIPIHQQLLSSGLRIIIYSGDVDMCVPYTGSEAWTNSLGFSVTDDWRPWLTADNQVAGYTKGWLSGQFTFATIKGAGHTVPAYKPKQALTFFQRWLGGNPL